MKRIVLHIICLSIAHLTLAQDFYFSQFNYAPTNINPGLAGHFDGKYRVHLNSRNQWSGFQSPFRTHGISLDMDSLGNTPISPMIGIYSDRAGDAKYGLLQISLAMAYKISFKKHLLSPGIQIALNNNNFSLADIAFDRNGGNDPIAGVNTRKNYSKINIGLTWTYYKSKKLIFHNGLSLFNLFQEEIALVGSFKNKQRINIHGQALIKTFNQFDLIPAYNISFTGNQKNINIGSEIKFPFQLEQYYLKALHAGMYYRLGNALVWEAGLNFNQIRLGLSYDMTIHSMTDNFISTGSFELSLRYIQPYKQKPTPFFRKCKEYI